MVLLVESTKSIKPTQLFIESPENRIPLEEKIFNISYLYNLLFVRDKRNNLHMLNALIQLNLYSSLVILGKGTTEIIYS